jgi:1-acyl-sn-glycerol-3-phosphate acyltransferase
VADSAIARVDRKLAFRHALQREIGRLLGPIWLPLTVFLLRFALGYRVDNVDEIRRKYRQIREESDAPLLICPNHLTLIDSFIIAWAINPWWRIALHFNELPWNTPERRNFAATWLSRILIYLAKCVPISRGGERTEVANVLTRITYLLSRGEVAVLFPEGGRSRTGRVSSDSLAWGVGRIVSALPTCRVVCVYLRGSTQETWGSIPNVGDSFYLDMECIEPKSDFRGARRSRDLANQIVTKLTNLERKYFDDRE